MRLKTWPTIAFNSSWSQLVLFIILNAMLCACATLPDSPKGDLCTIRLENSLDDSMGICAPIKEAKTMEVYNYEAIIQKLRTSSETHDIPMRSMDKYISFSPETWDQIASYIQELKAIAQRKCE